MSAATEHSVSVVVPVYNRERYLRESLDSVLTQGAVVSEIVVVDDGSTDGSVAVAESYGPPVRCVVQKNAGAASARNRGVQQATGEYIAFLDSDDIWMPGKLAAQLRAFADKPELDIVFGETEQFISPELDEETRRRLQCPAGAMPGYLVGAMLAKRTVFDRVGSFDTQWHVGEFIDWYVRARETGIRSAMLPVLVLRRRLHGTNTMITQRDSQRDYLRIVKASLDRRRSAPS
jgi:glycosyltransferase involved in cell wall biosynthesis